MKTGDKKGRLTAIKFVDRSRWGYQRWLFKCDCGKEKIILLPSIVSGNTLSCGCIRKELMAKKMTKHGMRSTGTYQSWVAMKRRCYDKNFIKYKTYGLRGIKMDESWNDFNNFIKDMGERPEGMSLGRINNNMNYCKENCRWETRRQQANNTRRNVYLTYKGETMSVADWARALDVDYEKFRVAVRRRPVIT